MHRFESQFFTATILEWKNLISPIEYKEIILQSLKYLVRDCRIYLHAFCIMDNHLHLIWQIRHPFTRDQVQRSFLRFTAQQIIKDLRNNNPALLEQFRVNAADRNHQIWERNPLSVELINEPVMVQKLNYIHHNPVKAGLCEQRADYWYSSARFYETGIDDWGLLVHYKYD